MAFDVVIKDKKHIRLTGLAGDKHAAWREWTGFRIAYER
ncbi:hypothetical protein CGMCC3_g17765 [Colletotrichum fructicola]|nr:uncharacterized protein CGMCC3_g17765 [Colletotrichum fructicola]KAE9566063.1 hypothetical protein CGMCC3_g17765 [Colletotrichum fructicola]